MTDRSAHTGSVPPEIDRLRRRPPGPRVLVALDQSTLSELALDDGYPATRDLLRGAVEAGTLVCPMSLGSTDETLDAGGIWQSISDLHEELSMGIEFLDPKQIRQREAFAAAAAFCGQPALYSVAEEAFDRDPQTSREELFSGGFRVIARLGPLDIRSTEVAREKDKEAGLQAAYDAARGLRRSYAEQAREEYEQMVKWVLGPLADPDYEVEVARKLTAATIGLMAGGDRGALSKYQAVVRRKDFADSLVVSFPALAGRAHEFARSEELEGMPALQYPALLRAGIAVRRGRLARRGDGYDIEHLTCGLSRCDFVTADAGMTQLVRDHKLAPRGCQIFSTREMQMFHTAVEAALSGASVGD
jgi:hypothetical protein